MLKVGVGRRCISPFWGVELTGWGYYLQRTWQTVHDELFATALVIDSGDVAVAVIALDLMVVGEQFTDEVRRAVHRETGLPPENIMVCCTHTHNAPASQGLEGVGAVDPVYEQWSARQAATAAILAWQDREPAELYVGHTEVTGLTFNRTREGGAVDPNLTVLVARRPDRSVLATVVNFQAHPTVSTNLRPRSVSRDVPGRICDRVETAFPQATAMYLQGACGDVNFLREFSTSQREHEPAEQIAEQVLSLIDKAEPLSAFVPTAKSRRYQIPTRRWTSDEISADRNEAERRLRDRDMHRWRETIGRAMTNRPEEMVARHGDAWKAVAAMCRFNLVWTERMLADWQDRPEWIETEIQSIRIGDFGIVSNASEFFSSHALAVRQSSPVQDLMIACYANGRIGYMPDADDIARKSYAAWQSPKYCNQFPFTEQSGPAMISAMLNSLCDEE